MFGKKNKLTELAKVVLKQEDRIKNLESMFISIARISNIKPEELADERVNFDENLAYAKEIRIRDEQVDVYNLKKGKNK